VTDKFWIYLHMGLTSIITLLAGFFFERMFNASDVYTVIVMGAVFFPLYWGSKRWFYGKADSSARTLK